MNMYAVLSGDIVSSTSLGANDKERLELALKTLIVDLSKEFDAFGRVIKGDYLEVVAPSPLQALQIALAIKAFVKGIPVEINNYKEQKKRAKLFKEHGIRLAIGYGELSRYKPEEGIIDGEAIYLSGRLINAKSTHGNERIVIKNTLFFTSNNEMLNLHITPVMELLDVLFSKATSRQSEVLYLKLMGNDENTIAARLGIDQSVVNRHSTAVGWNAIETSVSYFSTLMSKQ
ncbi:MAG: fumarate hydratase [Bacteroidetes bacterium]|nr:fumarate hydratase [Bacteroidota bacterium]